MNASCTTSAASLALPSIRYAMPKRRARSASKTAARSTPSISHDGRLRQGAGGLRRLRPPIEDNAAPFRADREHGRATDELLYDGRAPAGPDPVDRPVAVVDELDEPVAPAEADAAD